MKKITLLLFSLILLLGMTNELNAQKYELTGTESQVSQATEITLSNSTFNKFYYLFRIDDAGEYHYVTFMVGQGIPLKYASQTMEGKYLIYEFEEFKEMPFDFEMYNPEDGILQEGEAIISTNNN